MIAVHEHAGKYTVCTESGVICSGVARGQAATAIAATLEGITEDQIESALAKPTDAATFRTVFASAVAKSVLSLESEIASRPGDDALKAVVDRQESLAESVVEMKRLIERGRLEGRARELGAYLMSETNRVRAILTSKQQFTRFAEQVLQEQVAKYPEAVELASIRQRLEVL